MTRRAVPPVAAWLVAATLAACGGGGNSFSAGPVSPTPVPTPIGTGTPIPTAMPTSVSLPSSACKNLALPLPGTYAGISTFGNVNGTTYTQDAGPNSGDWVAVAYATASPGPTPIPTFSPSPAPTNPSPQPYLEYSGAYVLGGFSSINATGPYTVGTTKGCFLMVATQSGQPVSPGGSYNGYGIGFPGFVSATGLAETNVASGNITGFTVTNLTPTTGNGTFVLDNGAIGTATVTGSQVITFAHERARH